MFKVIPMVFQVIASVQAMSMLNWVNVATVHSNICHKVKEINVLPLKPSALLTVPTDVYHMSRSVKQNLNCSPCFIEFIWGFLWVNWGFNK